jgi:hypothetical protein
VRRLPSRSSSESLASPSKTGWYGCLTRTPTRSARGARKPHEFGFVSQLAEVTENTRVAHADGSCRPRTRRQPPPRRSSCSRRPLPNASGW